MVFPPDVSKHLPDGSLLAARIAEHIDHSWRRTGGKAAACVLFVAARDNASRDQIWRDQICRDQIWRQVIKYAVQRP
jgi:hypothetical protein